MKKRVALSGQKKSEHKFRFRTCAFSLFVFFLCLTSSVHAQIWHGCALAPDSRNAWVVTIETIAVYHTSNFGASWGEQVFDAARDFFDVFFLDSLNGWTCGRIADVWHTTDGGNEWNWQGAGNSKFFTRIQFVDTIHGWAAGGAAIVGRWNQEFETWEQQILPLEFSADTCDFYGISFRDTMNGWICAGRYPEGGEFERGQGYIGRTTNSGYNWTLLKRDTVNDYFDIKFRDMNYGWLVGGNDQDFSAYIAKTTDGGVTWIPQAIPAGGMLRAVAVPTRELVCAVGMFGTILRSTDAGTTWTKPESGVDSTLFDVEFSDAQHGIASGNNAILLTSDGGATWQKVTVGVREEDRKNLGTARVRIMGAGIVGKNSALGVRYYLSEKADVRLEVYDSEGRCVKRMHAGRQQEGAHELVWDCRDEQGRKIASGVQLVRIVAGHETARAKFVYLRE